MLSFFDPASISQSPLSLTASSLGTKSRCPIPRRPITLQNESAEAWLLWALSSAVPSPSSTALCTAGRGRRGVKAGTGGGEGGGEGGGDGGGVGQGEGEGRSRSGASVADDSRVSSKRPSGFLGVGRGMDQEQRGWQVCLGEPRFTLRYCQAKLAQSWWMRRMSFWEEKLITSHQTVSQKTDVHDAS